MAYLGFDVEGGVLVELDTANRFEDLWQSPGIVAGFLFISFELILPST